MNIRTLLSILLILTTLLCAVSCTGDEQVPQSDKIYSFRQGTIDIAIDSDVSHILSVLGAWVSYDETGYCPGGEMGSGVSKIYTYIGFEIETYPSGETDLINAIYLLDDNAKTPEGIAIGADKEAVKTAYGEPTSETATDLTYEGKGMRLRFLIKDGIVTNIQYLKK